MIHRDDLIGAIIASLQGRRVGEIYNAVDDQPVTQLNFFEWLAGTLVKDLPSSATADEATSQRRGLTNKQVSNRRLKPELGSQFRYATFRTGYTADFSG